MLYSRESIDEQAEREGLALQKQGKSSNANYNRTRLIADKSYNEQEFDKLFIQEG